MKKVTIPMFVILASILGQSVVLSQTSNSCRYDLFIPRETFQEMKNRVSKKPLKLCKDSDKRLPDYPFTNYNSVFAIGQRFPENSKKNLGIFTFYIPSKYIEDRTEIRLTMKESSDSKYKEDFVIKISDMKKTEPYQTPIGTQQEGYHSYEFESEKIDTDRFYVTSPDFPGFFEAIMIKMKLMEPGGRVGK